MNDSLFEYADLNNIFVEYKNIPKNLSLSTEAFGVSFVALDYSLLFNAKDEQIHLAHEIGHCQTGAFYNIHSPYDIREKHEYKADKWAVHEILPPDDMISAMQSGCAEVWQLAEHFDMPEDFIRRAIQIYQNEELIA